MPYLGHLGRLERGAAPPGCSWPTIARRRQPTPEAPRIVLLSSVLPDPCNLGYQDLRDLIVTAVNGVPHRQPRRPERAFAEPQGPFHVVEFPAGQGSARIVLDVEEAKAAAERIRQTYGVERLDSAGP